MQELLELTKKEGKEHAFTGEGLAATYKTLENPTTYTILCENPEDSKNLEAHFTLTLKNMELEGGKGETGFSIRLAPGQQEFKKFRRVDVFEEASFKYEMVYKTTSAEAENPQSEVVLSDETLIGPDKWSALKQKARGEYKKQAWWVSNSIRV